MSISISNSLSNPATADANSSATSRAAQTTQPAANISADIVRLSESQRVYQLYNQGQRVSEIASSLRLSVEAVNGYLGIRSTSG